MDPKPLHSTFCHSVLHFVWNILLAFICLTWWDNWQLVIDTYLQGRLCIDTVTKSYNYFSPNTVNSRQNKCEIIPNYFEILRQNVIGRWNRHQCNTFIFHKLKLWFTGPTLLVEWIADGHHHLMWQWHKDNDGASFYFISISLLCILLLWFHLSMRKNIMLFYSHIIQNDHHYVISHLFTISLEWLRLAFPVYKRTLSSPLKKTESY